MTSRARIPLSAQHIDEDEFEALRRGFAEGEISPTEQVAAFEEEFAAAVGGVQAAAVTRSELSVRASYRWEPAPEPPPRRNAAPNNLQLSSENCVAGSACLPVTKTSIK
jgi:hypothetical protein